MSDERKPTRAVERLRLTRRDLLKGLQVAGFGAAAAGVGAVGTVGVASAKTRKLSGTCRICTSHCGFVATVRDGRIVNVEGDPKSPTRGFLCQHGYALPEIVHAEDRIRRPLKREGSRFREIPWSQALPEIAERLGAVKKKWGGPAMALHTGWPFVRHPAIGYLQRFCYAFGSPNLSTVASLCEAALRMGKALTVGAGYFPDLPRARTLVLWGANPHHSMPLFAHQVASKSGEGRNLIVVDPVRTHHAKYSNLHLQILPGTDGALALGILRLLLDENLVDSKVAAEETVGLDELKALVAEWTLEKTAQVTTVPAELIAKAARTMASSGPTAIWDGLGVEHHENGIQTIRAIAAIQALLGGIDAPGGVGLFEKAGPNFANENPPAALPAQDRAAGPADAGEEAHRLRGVPALRGLQPPGAGEPLPASHPRGPALPAARALLLRLQRQCDLGRLGAPEAGALQARAAGLGRPLPDRDGRDLRLRAAGGHLRRVGGGGLRPRVPLQHRQGAARGLAGLEDRLRAGAGLRAGRVLPVGELPEGHRRAQAAVDARPGAPAGAGRLRNTALPDDDREDRAEEPAARAVRPGAAAPLDPADAPAQRRLPALARQRPARPRPHQLAVPQHPLGRDPLVGAVRGAASGRREGGRARRRAGHRARLAVRARRAGAARHRPRAPQDGGGAGRLGQGQCQLAHGWQCS
ncbi:MAG: molybdopterin-dependent oxidoreductase [Myxococcales bacterium]